MKDAKKTGGIDFGDLEVRIVNLICKIVGSPNSTWQQKRFQLRCMFDFDEEALERLAPEPKEIKDV